MAHQGQPQHVLAPPAKAAIFLVVTVRAGAEEDARDLLSDLAGLTRAVGFRNPEGELSSVVGVGAELWDRLYDAPRPAGLHPFRTVAGAVHTAVSTPGDLLFHLRAGRMDLCFELARQIMDRLAGCVDVADEVHGFRYFDERDLLGFVDGTESPSGPSALAVVHIGDEDPAYTGGSYVVVQKYLHDLDAWGALPIEEQEQAIGRRKLSDIELPDADKASNSHVALNTIVDPDGTEHKIVRDNMPFGAVGDREFGTYFIGYAVNPDVIERMLRNMFIGDPPGNHDRILDFSTAVTGGLFYVPTTEFLDDQPPRPTVSAATAAATATATAAATDATAEPPRPDGSLEIGSLRGAGRVTGDR
ncbi:Dyp-type peroxidase [Streptomyces sp. HNM0575]|uniref:Dyp-type peroxidase n=1 Tax=Streptomyces sp. HNM0575 TaxID=2716338 RepID=UPI00145E0E06|nr:Dyp-type peroxidase [Streptomyces sp. HNM0575]NLU75338.1 Dyp-type peroxidase [Streptomyces sp. HNM0575]